MSIYSKGFGFKFGIGRAKSFVIAGIVLLFIIFVAFTFYNLFLQAPLEARFEQNPWKQVEKNSDFLFVKVANITGSGASNAVLRVEPKAKGELIVFPKEIVLSETLAPNDSRELAFNIRSSLPFQKLPAGKYTISLTLSISGRQFQTHTILEVQ